MSEEQSSYRQILKATSLFGGVQVFNVIIAIVRSKFIAVFLGPAGMGIAGLLNSTLELIGGITNCGLGMSAVKDIAEAYSTQDTKRISIVITIFRRLVWITGSIGCILTIILSSYLSKMAFGNSNYAFAFVLISITLLISQIKTGQMVILQGMRKLNNLAKVNVVGNILGLVVIFPIYFYFGINGIVPCILLISISALIVSWYYSRSISLEHVSVSYSDTLLHGRLMLKMGVIINLSGLITLGYSYLLKIYIGRNGGLHDVGFYNASFSIIESYVGMIFTAMSTDYYPRLSLVSNDKVKINSLVSQQATIAILILLPIVVIFLIFSPFIIQLIYSSKFLPITGLINLAIIGVIFKAVSWSMGFVLFAKGDSKFILLNSIGFSLIFLLNNIVCYNLFGLNGIGFAYIVNYFLHFVGLFFLNHKRYDFSFDSGFYKRFVIVVVICFAAYFINEFHQKVIIYSFSSIILVIAILFSLLELNKIVGLNNLIFNKMLKK